MQAGISSNTGSPPTSGQRWQSRGEELANSISHGSGLVAALVAAPFLIVHAAHLGNAGYIVGTSIFVATMVLLYLSSALYHMIRPSRVKHVFRIIDHSVIYLLIAGTYTPFTLGVLYGAWGWTLFGLIWGLAAIGITLKIVNGTSHPIASTLLYLFMGWLVLIAVDPLHTLIPLSGLLWLLAGGLSYTAGVAFFFLDSRLRYGHFIWHLFVIAGTTCHYFAVYWYAA